MVDHRLSRWGVVVCLLFFFWLGVDTAVSKAPTVDEYMHIMRGRVLWQTQTFPFQQEHAPLAHWFIGSLLNLDPTLANVTELPSWPTQDRFPIAREFLWLNHQPPTVERILLLARLPIIFVGLMLGAVLVRWAGSFVRQEWRRAAAWPMLVVGIFFAFSPNLIAAFSIATTDAMLVATFVTAVFMMWRYWQKPSWRRWLLAGLFSGLALASKITALTLFPALGLICLVEWQRRGVLLQPRSWPKFLGMGVVYVLVTAVTLWATYLFELRPIAALNSAVPIPAATYASNFLRVQEHVNEGHVSFLLGEMSGSGWWHYFAVAVVVKAPAVVLLLTPVAAAVLLWRRTFLRTIYFWLPALLLFIFASATRLNIGFRHILPVLPFLWLMIGTAVSLVIGQREGYGSAKPLQIGLGILLGFVIFGTIRQHPHHLAYFNELVGGSANGAKYLADSNLDWGQDIRLASDYVKQSGREDVHISYYGSGNLDYYGFADRSMHPEDEEDLLGDFAAANPAPGVYIVSVSHLQGLGVDDPDLLDWFRHQPPIEQLGFTTNVYNVPSSAQGEWVGYCNDPVALLSPEESDRLLGTAVTRRVYFDCRNSWVLPAGGQPGWYILPQGESTDWPLSRAHPEHMRLVYRHRPSNFWPSFDIYYWDGLLDVTDRFAGQTAVSNQEDTPLPITVGDAAQLIGYEQNGADWWTVWQASQPAAQPLTIAGHLYGDALPPTVSDGLGFSGEQWQAGDIIWQRHAFAPEVNGRYLETGLYNYVTGERLAEFVQLRPLQE